MALELGSGQRPEEFRRTYRESLNCLGQAVNRNLDIENAASENSKRSEKRVWKLEGEGSFVVTESLAQLSPAIMYKAEHVSG